MSAPAHPAMPKKADENRSMRTSSSRLNRAGARPCEKGNRMETTENTARIELLKIQNSRKPEQVISLVRDPDAGGLHTEGLTKLFHVQEIWIDTRNIAEALTEYARVLLLMETMSESEDLHLPTVPGRVHLRGAALFPQERRCIPGAPAGSGNRGDGLRRITDPGHQPFPERLPSLPGDG